MNILITGGTGSVGQILTAHYYNKHKITIFSRNEYRSWLMKQKFPLCKYVLGDVQDKDTLLRAFENQDCVIHLAALKHVSFCELNPLEAIKTNVLGTQNVIDALKYFNTTFAVFMSTDKAEAPINCYGSTKLLAEHLWSQQTNYPIIRAGNLINSTGSVLEIYKRLLSEGKRELPCTSDKSVRYWMSPTDLNNLFDSVIDNLKGVYVPALRKFRIIDLIEALNCTPIITSLTLGEKTEETLYTDNTTVIGDKSIVDTFMSIEDIQTSLKEL
jgi:UDP-N-acetylglucosamine 4,6-dehydratase